MEARLRDLQSQSTSLEDAAAQVALSKRQLEANELSLAEQRAKIAQEHGVKTQVYRMAQNLEENLAVCVDWPFVCFVAVDLLVLVVVLALVWGNESVWCMVIRRISDLLAYRRLSTICVLREKKIM